MNNRTFFNTSLETQLGWQQEDISLSSSTWIKVADWEISAGKCDVFIAISQLPVEILQSGTFRHSNYKVFSSSSSAPLLSWAELRPNCLSSTEPMASFPP